MRKKIPPVTDFAAIIPFPRQKIKREISAAAADFSTPFLKRISLQTLLAEEFYAEFLLLSGRVSAIIGKIIGVVPTGRPYAAFPAAIVET
jgi:hypothetical protein